MPNGSAESVAHPRNATEHLQRANQGYGARGEYQNEDVPLGNNNFTKSAPRNPNNAFDVLPRVPVATKARTSYGSIRDGQGFNLNGGIGDAAGHTTKSVRSSNIVVRWFVRLPKVAMSGGSGGTTLITSRFRVSLGSAKRHHI